ncbi:YihY/virulence factor BrkB family protein [Candidatus Sororendozoicomonas aggregata]|uniref:YihY/virulence factor BrkB family protein n=1 Tax=Candidatus Sororendozoicomonas aggregata TaxID=3073239 RepID=UPI002ED4F6DA
MSRISHFVSADQVKYWLWHLDERGKHGLWRLGINMMRVCYAVMRDMANGQLSLRAMSLVYTTLVSLVPLLALSFSVLKGFGVHNQIEPLLLNLLKPLGNQRFDIVSNIIGFVDNIKVGVLGAVGLAFLLYSVIAMMQKIEESFNFTWHIRQGRTLSQRFSDYLSVILIGPLLIFLSIGITATVKSHAAVTYITHLPFMGSLIEVIGFLVPWLVMAAAFTFIYFYMPNTRVNIGSAFIGGLITAIAWKVMGLLFSSFIAGSTSQTAIYSAFASAIAFMIWLYLGWLMLLIGASIAYYHQNPQNQLFRKDEWKMSAAEKERLILTISFMVAQRFAAAESSWDAKGIALHLGVPTNVVEACFDKLAAVGFLVKTLENPQRVMPTKPLDQLNVSDIAGKIHRLYPSEVAQFKVLRPEMVVERYLQEREQLIKESFGDLNYETFVRAS